MDKAQLEALLAVVERIVETTVRTAIDVKREQTSPVSPGVNGLSAPRQPTAADYETAILVNHGLLEGKLVDPGARPTFESLSIPHDDRLRPALFQDGIRLANTTEDQRNWRRDGYLIKKRFFSDNVLDRYAALRQRLALGREAFPEKSDYRKHREMLDLCCDRDLHYLLVDLVGRELGLHSVLSAYEAVYFGWHQDDTMNPPDTAGNYVGVWIAIDDVDERSGPFEFVPGSHRWPQINADKLKELVIQEARDDERLVWTVYVQWFIDRAVAAKIAAEGAQPQKFLAEKGDVLIWNGALAHRPSVPADPEALRPALIGHYGAVQTRRDWGAGVSRHGAGGYYFDFGMPAGLA